MDLGKWLTFWFGKQASISEGRNLSNLQNKHQFPFETGGGIFLLLEIIGLLVLVGVFLLLLLGVCFLLEIISSTQPLWYLVCIIIETKMGESDDTFSIQNSFDYWWSTGSKFELKRGVLHRHHQQQPNPYHSLYCHFPPNTNTPSSWNEIKGKMFNSKEQLIDHHAAHGKYALRAVRFQCASIAQLVALAYALRALRYYCKLF